jgi:hypothetical protein
MKPGVRKGAATLVLHEEGMAGLVDPETGQPKPLVTRLLTEGRAVLLIEPFGIGRAKLPEGRAEEIGKYRFFTTYNRTDLANRVQDILTALAYLRDRPEVSRVQLVGLGEAGLWSLLARGLARDVDATVVDAARFSAKDDDAFRERLFIPGLRRAGDLRTAGVLAAPGPLFIHNTTFGFPTDWFHAAYHAAGVPNRLRLQDTPAGDEEILWWLGRQK